MPVGYARIMKGEGKGEIIDVPDTLHLGQIQERFRVVPASISSGFSIRGVGIGKVENYHWVEVKQIFPIYKGNGIGIKLNYSAYNTETVSRNMPPRLNDLESVRKSLVALLAEPAQPGEHITIVDSRNNVVAKDPGDFEFDEVNYDLGNRIVAFVISNGILLRVDAQQNEADGWMDFDYTEALKKMTGNHYKGRLSPEQIGKMRAEEVVRDVLDELVTAIEIESGLRK